MEPERNDSTMTRPADPIENDRTVWLELAAEQATIAKRRRTLDTVRVTTRTRTRDEVVDEPLTSETVTVERVPVGRYVDAVPAVRQEGDVTIMPVVDEEVVVTRRLFLREEVHVHRTRLLSRHVETISLREQFTNVSRVPAEPSTAPVLPTRIGMDLPEHPSRSFVMDEETIVAVYDTSAAADAAVGDLRAANVPGSAISRHSGTNPLTTEAETESNGHDVGFWEGLFGSGVDHHDDATVYNRSVGSGSSVVAVRTPAHDVTSVLAILERHSPIDIDERAAEYGLSAPGDATGATMGVTDASTSATMSPETMTGMATGAAAGSTMPTAAATGTGLGSRTSDDGMMQLSEEQIAIGKRVVNRGGTRIRRYVVETPVEETVSLRDEKVTLERRPVTDGRPVVDGSFSERTIEMTETAEEAVVSKTARVVEEVGLRKEATDRMETIRDTVRKEEVDVEQLPGEATNNAAATRTAGATPKV